MPCPLNALGHTGHLPLGARGARPSYLGQNPSEPNDPKSAPKNFCKPNSDLKNNFGTRLGLAGRVTGEVLGLAACGGLNRGHFGHAHCKPSAGVVKLSPEDPLLLASIKEKQTA